MMPIRRLSLIQAWSLLLLGATLVGTEVEAQPRITVIATGGGIAGVQADVQSPAARAGSLPVESLVNSVPAIDRLAKLSTEQFANVGSQNIDERTWIKLARRVNELQRDKEVDGIVVTHGTDTLEESAYFLDLVVQRTKPVVLVGAMRPATAISADGPMNLYNAVAVAGSPEARGRGVLVVINDEIHAADDVQQRNTARLDAFHSPNHGRIGVVNTGVAVFYGRPPASSPRFSIPDEETLPRVDIIYAHAGMRRELIDAAASTGAKGIVLAGVGDGNAPAPVLSALSEAAHKGVTVVRSSRTGSGRVTRNMEVPDDRLGFVAALDLNPQKARILLMLGLVKTHDPAALQDLFARR
ncbi:MAG: asparaginase [Methylotetracoccus sp.]